MAREKSAPGGRVRRVAFYVRVSTERQAQVQEGSLKNQQQMLAAELKRRNSGQIWGKLVGSYVDGGFSGKNIERPEFKRLLADVENGTVNAIFFTELSRLSRSLRDFLNIFEFTQEHKCDLICLKTEIDTTSPFSNLVVKILMVFAEFEREMTAERTRRNALERARRGLANGGPPPLGYKRDPENKGHLLIDDSAKIVRAIFRAYLRFGTAGKTMEEVRRKFHDHPDVKRIGRSNVYYMLRNRSYLGLREISGGDQETEVEAAWPALIDQKTFDAVQEILSQTKKGTGKANYNYWLSGTLVCGACNQPLSGWSARSRTGSYRRYYSHRQPCPEQGLHDRIPAEEIQNLVHDHLLKLSEERKPGPELVQQIQSQIKRKMRELEQEKAARQSEADQLSRQIDERLEQLKVLTLPEVRLNLENDIARLQSEHQLLLLALEQNQTQIERLAASSKQNPELLLKICEKEAVAILAAQPVSRQKIQAFVASIALHDAELAIRFPVAGHNDLLIENRIQLPGILLLRSRNLLEHFLEKEKLGRNEIARRLHVSRSAVGTAIHRLGLLGPESAKGKIRRTPFGYDKRDGKLIRNDEEQKALLLMRQMQKNGGSLRAIADELNRRRIPTKQGGSWQANTVNKILRVQSERES
jgi:site-specific DNA recombinase